MASREQQAAGKSTNERLRTAQPAHGENHEAGDADGNRDNNTPVERSRGQGALEHESGYARGAEHSDYAKRLAAERTDTSPFRDPPPAEPHESVRCTDEEGRER